MKFFDDNLSLDNPFGQSLVYEFVIDQALNYKFFSLPLGRFQVDKRTHLIHMELH